ncbi:MAG: exonuclease SbcCD subunit D, partial [Candidatus Woesearchaeota archaeon]
MKYAHLADLHLGSWRDEKMRSLSTNAFLTAIDNCVAQQVDFILFAGDLFNTSLPSLDILKTVTKKLKELSEKDIPIYVIPGSHDFSPSGKTMIDVLEHAGLLKNVCKGIINPETKQLELEFTIDKKTGAKITGILGRKGLLDKTYYENLNLEKLEKEEGYKIFMFHTTLTELKPKHLEKLDSQPASFLPKRFDYYAGGHIHHPTKVNVEGIGILTYPGALFPNNFYELERYSKGGYYLIEKSNVSQEITWQPLEVIKHHKFELDCNHKSPEVVAFEIQDNFNNLNLKDTIVTIRLKGKLKIGRVSDINFKVIFEQLYKQEAYFVMKNTSELNTEDFEDIKIAYSNPESVEEEIIKEHLQQLKLFD